MDCPGCDGKNRDDARFCKFCGADLFAACRMCGAVLDEDARFCDACGTPSGDAATAPAPAAASRKVVTVLFADLSGSTALEERMDAESVRSILDRFYAGMRTEVERHSGRVVKFTGDGVMAAFGVPDVHEDDAARAVDAALSMREELEQLADDLQLDVALNIGINTGEVVVSETDDDVVGDAVNVAARLEGAAQGGEILVGEDTWRLTRSTSRYEPVVPLTLKGKAEPVPAYRLLSVDERTADSAAAPFVGREAELGKLLTAFEEAVDANAARLVTIIGSPGLGKTRLARELMSELSDVARVRETRCDPAGSSTFAPIADTLRAAAGISETDTEDEVLAALAARIPEDDPDRDRIAMRAGAIFGVGQAGTTEETFWAIRRIIEAAARVQPVVFVLDDIHWAEPLLLDLIEHLAEWIRDAPVLLIGTARPELRDLRPSLAEGGRATAVIALEGLDREATAKLALNLLGADELPAELLAKIPVSTEGNPLFVRELVRMLVDDGVLMRTGDGWTVTVDVEAIQVPPTIQSLLSARVDRLRSDERTVVELAAVVGKEFYRGALYDLAPPAVKELVDGCLESLRRKELVEPVGTYWIDEPVYRFHHVLIRDAAYRRLLKESRADLHERVAEWLERKTAGVLGEHDELLGYHLEQAHDYKRQLGRHDDDLGRRAAALLGAAARRALDGDDLPAAATLSGRALDRLADDDLGRPELLLIRCEALLSMGDVSQGAPAVVEFERLATTPRLSAWATCFNGHLANLTAPERLNETEAVVAAAAAELAGLGDQAGTAKAHTVHASTLAGLGRFAECEAVLDDALTAARAANDRRRITATLGSAPHAALWGPNPVSRAGGRCLDIVRLLRITTGSPAVEQTSLRCQAVLEAFRGRADAARSMLRKAQRALTELGLQHELLETEQFAGIVELVAGDAAAAIVHLRTAHDGFRKVGVDVLAAQSAALLARAHLMLGEEVEAEAFVGTSEQLGSQDLKTAIAWRSVKAEILARRGGFDEARRLAEAAVELAEGTDALYDHGIACRSLANVLRAAGDAAGARRADERAFALFERKGATALLDGEKRADEVVTPSGPSSRDPLHNECATAYFALIDVIRTRDWDAVRSKYSEDVTFEDGRQNMTLSTIGSDELVRHSKVIADLGVAPAAGARLVATRGRWLGLFGITMEDTTGLRVEVLQVAEANIDGAFLAFWTFDSDELGAALLVLDERYVLGEGAADPELVSMIAALADAHDGGDADLLRSLFTDDLVAEDRRPASAGRLDRDGFVRWIEATWELTLERTGCITSFEALAPGRAVVRVDIRGTTREESHYETSLLVLFVRRGDRIANAEQFLLEQRELALARFAELATGESSWPRIQANRCVRIVADYVDAINRRDFTRNHALLGERASHEDRRTGMRTRIDGKDAIVEQLRVVAGLGGPVRLSNLPIATRGNRLALVINRWYSADEAVDFEVEILILVEIDEEDRIERVIVFDAEDLDAAFAELEERYLAGEGAAQSDLIRREAAAVQALNERDWERLSNLFLPDARVVDHTPVGRGDMSVDEWIASHDALVDLTEELCCRVVAMHAVTDHLVHSEPHNRGVSRDGGEIDVAYQMVTEHRDGHVARMDLFAAENLDAAKALFDERSLETTSVLDELGTSVAEHGPSIKNAAASAVARAFEAIERADVDAYVRLHADDVSIEDRRAGLRLKTLVEGKPASEEWARTIIPVSATQWTTLATRGERLVLGRGRVVVRDFTIELLEVAALDGDGLICAWIMFDPQDLDAAFAELDQRYLDGEGAGFGDTLDILRGYAAWTAHDWDAFASTLHFDVRYVDHRLASFDEVRGRDELMALASRVLTEDMRHDVVAVRAVDHGRAIVQIVAGGTNAEGGAIEVAYFDVLAVGDGLFLSCERFAMDDFDGALAAFEDLARAEASLPFRENLAIRNGQRRRDCFDRRDWDGFGELLTDDSVSDDRRKGMRLKIAGRDERLANMRAIVDVGIEEISSSTIATRGERICLVRSSFRGPADQAFYTELLQLHECDEEGRLATSVAFDPDDLDAAFAELDERYAKGEAALYAEVVGMASRMNVARNSRDWDMFGAVFAEDLATVDHRPITIAAVNNANLVVVAKALTEIAPDVRHYVVAIHAIAANTCVTEVHVRGTNTEGGPFEIAYLQVLGMRDGLCHRATRFGIEQLDEALIRFQELAESDSSGARDLENACTRAVAELFAAMERHDLPGFLDRHADTFTHDDRRTGLRHVLNEKDELTANVQAAWDLGAGRYTIETHAIRGERLALNTKMYYYSGPDGTSEYENPQLLVDEIDEEGRVILATVFEPDDFDGAFKELDERYLAGEAAGTPSASIIRSISEYFAAYNRRDWNVFAEMMTPDFLLVDHRPAGAGTLHGEEEAIRYLQVMVDQVPDIQIHFPRFVTVAPAAALCRMWAFGTTTDDTLVEVVHYLILKWENGFTRIEIYPLDQEDVALGRLEELGRDEDSPHAAPDNDASRAVATAMRLILEQDWDALAACHAPDVRVEERRAGLQWEGVGTDALLERTRSFVSVPVSRVENECLASRGSKLALVRQMVIHSDPWESERIVLTEIDDDGRIAFLAFSDPDDLDAAFDELDRRFLASNEPTESYRTMLECGHAYNARDWARYRSLHVEDFVFVDSRQASAGTIVGADAAVVHRKTLADVVPDIRIAIRSVIRVEETVCLAVQWKYGTDEHGNKVEFDDLILLAATNGVVTRAAAFAIDQLDDALARFEELSSRPSSVLVPENAAFRAVLRVERAAAREDWEAVATEFAETSTTEDRRVGLKWHWDVTETLRNMRDEDPTARFVQTLIATRSERWALLRQRMTRSEFETEFLRVVELDEHGRLHYSVRFDPDELGAAFAELDERFFSSDESTEAQRIAAELVRAYNARDWDRVRGVSADDYTYVDHHPASAGVIDGVDATIDHWGQLISLVPDLLLLSTAYPASNDRCVMSLARSVGTDEYGSPVEREHLAIAQILDGQITRLETFPHEQLGAAKARFDVLSAEI